MESILPAPGLSPSGICRGGIQYQAHRLGERPYPSGREKEGHSTSAASHRYSSSLWLFCLLRFSLLLPPLGLSLYFGQVLRGTQLSSNIGFIPWGLCELKQESGPLLNSGSWWKQFVGNSCLRVLEHQMK